MAHSLSRNVIIIIIIISQLISFNCGKIRDISSYLPNTVSKCVTEISGRYFPVGNSITTAFMKDNRAMDIFNNLFCCQQKWTICIKIPSKKVYQAEDSTITDNYIIYFTDEKELYEILMYLRRFLKWNSSSKFTITSDTVFQHPQNVAVNLTSILWSFRVTQYVIVLVNSSDLELLDIYTWHPYTNGNCGDKFNDTKVINQCKDGVLEYDTNLFPIKMFNDLNGCTINAEAIRTEPYVFIPKSADVTDLKLRNGISVVVLETIANATNFKVNYSTSVRERDYGITVTNGTTLVISGIIDNLVNNRVDIGIGIFPVTSIRYRYLALSNPYMVDYITCVVPRARQEPKWKCLFKIFRMSTWALTGLTLMLAALCLWGLAHYSSRETTVYQILPISISNSFGVLLGLSVRQPRSGISRIFFIIWVIFCLHLTISYQTSLISVLTSPSYEKQITTIEEVFNQKMSIGFSASVLQYFNNDDDWRAKKISKEWIECSGLPCLKRVVLERNFVYITSRLYVKYLEEQYLNKKRQSSMYLFKNNAVNLNIVIALSRGFPLLHRVNVLLARFRQAGLIDLWIKNVKKTRHNIGSFSSKYSRLSLFNLQTAFIILGFGLSVSVIVFALEIIVYKGMLRRFSKAHKLETFGEKKSNPLL